MISAAVLPQVVRGAGDDARFVPGDVQIVEVGGAWHILDPVGLDLAVEGIEIGVGPAAAVKRGVNPGLVEARVDDGARAKERVPGHARRTDIHVPYSAERLINPLLRPVAGRAVVVGQVAPAGVAGTDPPQRLPA